MTALSKTWTLDADFDSGSYVNAQAVDDAVEIIVAGTGSWLGTYDPGAGTRPEWQSLELTCDFAAGASAYVRFRATTTPGATGERWLGPFLTQARTTVYNLRLPDATGHIVKRKRYFEVDVILSGDARLLDVELTGLGSVAGASPGQPVLVDFEGASGAFAASSSSARAVTGESAAGRIRNTVVRAHNPVPVPDGGGDSEWFETFTPGVIDVWSAVRMLDGELQGEWQLTCREQAWINTLTVVFAGANPVSIAVRRIWPAGRSISGRFGPEMPLDPLWDDTATGPLNMPLAAIADQSAVNANYVAGLAALRACIALGRSGDVTASCTLEDSKDGIFEDWEGPFACWGSRDGGLQTPGGDGIYHPWGWQNSVEYARYACEASAVAMTRQWVCVNATGAHASVDDYGLSPYVDDNSLYRLAAWDVGDDLLMHPQQTSHYVRVLRYVGAAWEMTRSRLARRQLIQMAEMARLMWSENGDIILPTGVHGGGFFARNFSTFEWAAYNYPDGTPRPANQGSLNQWGYVPDRSFGWTMYVAAMAKKAGMTWTDGWADWAQRHIDMFEFAQMANGLFSRSPMPPSAYPDTTDITASMHEAIMGIGLAALGEQTGVDVTPILIPHATALYDNPNPDMIQPYHGAMGPWHWIRTGTNSGAPSYTPNSADATVSIGYGEPSAGANVGDPAHAETYLAVMHKLTADSGWLDRSILFGGTAVDIATKKANILADDSLSGEDFVGRNWTMWLLGQYP